VYSKNTRRGNKIRGNGQYADYEIPGGFLQGLLTLLAASL